MSTYRAWITDEYLSPPIGKLFLILGELEMVQDLSHTILGLSTPVGPCCRAQHLVTFQEDLVQLPESVACSPDPNILHQAENIKSCQSE